MDNLALGRVTVLQSELPYIADPLPVFSELTEHGERKRTLLLESVEIDTKRHTRSLLLLNSALEIRCRGNSVSVCALTANGQQLITYIAKKLPREVTIYEQQEKLLLVFPAIKAGVNEEQRLKELTPIHVLRTLINEIKSTQSEHNAVFLGGVFAYDLIATFEDLPDVEQGINPCPDMLFYLAETMLVVDHIHQTCLLQHSVFGGPQYSRCYKGGYSRMTYYEYKIRHCRKNLPLDGEAPIDDSVSVNVSDEQFCNQVAGLKENIIAGDVFQAVPSRCFSVPCADSMQAYRQLKLLNPSPYMFYLNDTDFVLFGASPESALGFSADVRQVAVYPIAGTRKRGKHPNGEIDLDYDSRIELELRTDEKEVAEHLMLVDLARNDIARISVKGSRYVASLLKVDRYSHVMHLVSRVVGTLREDLDALHAYQACMNMGTLVGAPKIRAAQLVRDVEKTRRGSYGGAIGYLNGHGDMDTCIVIRSACVVNGVAHIQAGAGVVYDSDPQSEADETRNKAQAVIQAVLRANDLARESQLDELLAAPAAL